MTFSVPQFESIPVSRPDHILDVTDVVECIVGVNNIPLMSLLRRFQPRKPNAAAIRGTLINAAFDFLVADADMSDDDVLHHVSQLRPLSLAAIGDAVRVESIRAFLPTMREVLRGWRGHNVLVEPHVVSKTWGMQGRFDILVERNDGVELIEMKSGTAPGHSPRANHVAQVSAYALLYSELNRKPLTKVTIWYVGDTANPFRSVSASHVQDMQQRVLRARNAIVEIEQTIGQRDFSPLREINEQKFASTGPIAEFAQEFATVYHNADPTSRTLAQAWMSFLMREQFSTRIGAPRQSNQLFNMKLDIAQSEIDRKHLHFLSDTPFNDMSLRVGDQIVLSQNGGRNSSLLLKGAIRALHTSALDVTLRNKQADVDDSVSWDIVQDSTDTSIRNLYPGIVSFMSLSEQRRNVLMGAEQSHIPKKVAVDDDSLFPDQHETVERALGSEDLFFIQGPPGTGKTRAVLRAIVKHLLSVPHERVLIVAYTNRAVSEICDVLAHEKLNGEPLSFLRHGSKDGMSMSQSGDHAIPFLAAHMDSKELADAIRKTKCIVSTIHSMHSSPEIFSFGSFTSLIVDEASQVLEPHIIGLLASTSRAILIGDQCQLPAVVSQEADLLGVSSPILKTINVQNLATSYFDRMVSCYRDRGWDASLATLSSQGRMHADIMAFPSKEFYRGQLKTIHSWQTDSEPLPWSKFLPKRSHFIPISETPERQNAAEAKLLADLAGQISDAMKNSEAEFSIGIITPFRVQNNAVIALLPKELRAKILVDTVERFQGSQCDVILYGTGVTNEAEFQTIRSEYGTEAGLVDRKFNVACTRARHQFVLIGDPRILALSSSYANFIALAGK